MAMAGLARVVAVYRARADLEPSHVAEQAGISTAQYLALEEGTGWPGEEAVAAIVEALRIPHAQRPRLTGAGAPIDPYLRQVLHQYCVPALLVDSSWRTAEANAYAHVLFPELDRPGWNLMGWMLFSSDARKRLANWEAVAQSFTDALGQGLATEPHNPELCALGNEATGAGFILGPNAHDQPDGQTLNWRTSQNAHSATTCLVTVPPGRPDLRQIVFVPRSDELATRVGNDPHPSSLLSGLILCGHCGLLLADGAGPTTVLCPTGCLPELPTGPIERSIVHEALKRAFSAQNCRELGNAQDYLLACGGELKLNVPVSSRHALDQWQRSMTAAQRRGILTSTLRTAKVLRGVRADGYALQCDWIDI
ncbi:helix-turn-helix domain-containing protein [Streptomyces sp. NPDC001941]|uniref:MmyB family transcriptional regulator n=1 Tax=Streptomyces sp. NPDC001941 TaxID=3154659 RepID=UPI00331ECB7B